MSHPKAFFIQTQLLLNQSISPQALLNSTLAQLPAPISSLNQLSQTFYIGNPNEFTQVYATFAEKKLPVHCLYQGRLSGLAALNLAAEYVQRYKNSMVAVVGFSYRLPSKKMGCIFNERNDTEFLLTEPLMVERLAKLHDVTKEEQDIWSLKSYQKYQISLEIQSFQEKIYDETIKKQTFSNKLSLAHLEQLKPCFKKAGTLTTGNTAHFYEHASCLLLAGEEFVQANNMTPLADWMGTNHFYLSQLPMDLGLVHGMLNGEASISDIEWIEIDEAYAALACLATRLLSVEENEKVNPIGGALVWGDAGVCNGLIRATQALWGMKRRLVKDSFALISAMDADGQGALGGMQVYSQGGRA